MEFIPEVPGNSGIKLPVYDVYFISEFPGNSEICSPKKFKLFLFPCQEVLGIRYWVLGTGYQVLATSYWVPGRPEADLREAGGRLIGESRGRSPRVKMFNLFSECLNNARSTSVRI